MSKILVCVELKDGNLKSYSKELLSVARDLATKLSGNIEAVYFSESETIDLAQENVERSYAIRCNPEERSAKALSQLFDETLEKSQPTHVLASSTSFSRELLPRIAMRRDLPLFSDCTSYGLDGEALLLRRPMFSGKLSAQAKLQGNLVLVSFRPNSFETKKSDSSAAGEQLEVSADKNESGMRFVSKEEAKSDRPDLVEAEVVVSAGRSIKSEENFQMVYDLADSIGAAAGASRAAVDAGFAPHSIQVGQTGKTVSPKLYFAFGISGAIQHLAGMSSSKVIVAVNTDPEAPIFQKCDYGIVGDLFDLIPVFKEELAKLKAS